MVIWLCNQIAMCSVSRCDQIKRKPNLDSVPIALLYACLFLRTPYDFFLICLVVVTHSMVLCTFRLQHCGLPTDGMMHFHYLVSFQRDNCLFISEINPKHQPTPQFCEDLSMCLNLHNSTTKSRFSCCVKALFFPLCKRPATYN